LKSGQSAIMISAERGYERLTYMLLNKDADVFEVDKLGDNALHKAAIGGSMTLVKLIATKFTEKRLNLRSLNTVSLVRYLLSLICHIAS
jgi:ankyrin repeat protein